METIQYGTDVIYVKNGKLSCNNKTLLNMANSILIRKIQMLRNTEVYPDIDLSISNYIKKTLKVD
jgi:hypothetical protein